MNKMFVNQSMKFVSEIRQSVWIDGEKGDCRAFSWNVKAVTIAKMFACSEKFHPACILDTDNRLCSKEPLDDINSKDSVKTILIASLCGGTAVLICIMIVCVTVSGQGKPEERVNHMKLLPLN